MKNLLLLLFAGVLFNTVAQSSKTIKPKPNKVTVYLYGAEIAYDASVGLSAGSNEIIVEGVSPYMDENTISAFFKGAMIIDTRKGVRYPEQIKAPDREKKYNAIIERITDSLEELEYSITDCNNKKATLEKEKYLLLNNRLMRGEFAKDSLNLLKSSLDLLRVRMNNIDEESLNQNKKLNKLYKVQGKLLLRKEHYENLAANEIMGKTEIPYTPIYQLIVTVESETAMSGNLNFKYYVANAGWLPRYDIIAGSGNDKIQLVQRAQVSQSTGVDWKDVSLVLSTSNPNMGNIKPELNMWNLIYGYPNSYIERKNKDVSSKVTNNYLQYNSAPKLNITESLDFDGVEQKNSPQVEPIFTMNENLLRVEYSIKTKCNIESDNKSHNVVVSTNDVPITMTYMAVPKLDKDAFLMAKVANWEDLNLLPANARIYFDESYIGMTVVDPGTVKDTLYMDLGRDRTITVKRIQMKDRCKEQILGDDKVIIKTIEITVRNTKGIPLDFEIEDQIPVSGDPSIKVTLLDSDKALYNELTGKLTWKLKVKSKDIKKIQFSFEVRYPKTKIVSGL